MFLHIQDWSRFINLVPSHLPKDSHVLKIYASQNDPKELYPDINVKTFEVDHSPLKPEELFSYRERGTYNGKQVETEIEKLNLNELQKEQARALFRFANLPETQIAQVAMGLKNLDGSWLINHPIETVHELQKAGQNPERQNLLHLDIFIPEVLDRMKKLLGEESLDNCEGIVLQKEARNFFRSPVEAFVRGGKEG